VKCYIWSIDLYCNETWIHATHNKGMKANWIGHVLRMDCLLKHVVEGEVEGKAEATGRRVRRHKQLLEDLK